MNALLIATLPDTSLMGMFANNALAPAWEGEFGPLFDASDLLACADWLEARAKPDGGWTHVRERADMTHQAGFLRRAAELRTC